LESFAPNHARGPAFILEHGDPSGLILRTVFGLALRQTEGLIGSIIHLLGIELAVPDHSTLGRRAQTVTLTKWTRRHAGPLQLFVDSTGLKPNGPGEWLVEKHGTTKRRSWHKLYIGLDAVSGEIVVSTLTGRDIDDGSQVAALLDQVDGSVGVFMGDGAYDSADVYAAVEERHPDALVIVPPRAGAVASSQTSPTSVTDTFGTCRQGPSRLAGCQRIQSTRFGRGSYRPLQACHRQRPSISYRGV
jgi:hypothetical protein